jgi:hypothetical protein
MELAMDMYKLVSFVSLKYYSNFMFENFKEINLKKTYNGDTESLMLITANLRCICLNWPKNAIEATQEEPGDEGGPEIGAEPKHNVEDNSAHQQINIISLQAVLSN